MNRPAVIQAAYFFCVALGEEPTVRNVGEMIRRASGKGIRGDDVRKWLQAKRERDTLGTHAGYNPEYEPDTASPHKNGVRDTTGIQDESSSGYLRARAVKVLELEDHEVPSGTSRDLPHTPKPKPLALLAAPEPKPKPKRTAAKKAERIPLTSSFAGVTWEAFGAFAADLREIVSRDARKDGTMTAKALDAILSRLAMQRAKYGDEAFAYGIEVTLHSPKLPGHGYIGGVCRNYDPERDGKRERFEPRERYEPNASDRLPTLTELIAAGKVEPITEAEVLAERPAWFSAQIAAQAAG